MINNFIPLVVLGYFLLHIKKTGFQNFLVNLIFVSFFVFATNYTHYGLDIDIFRYLHRVIGIIVVADLLIHIIRNKINFFKDTTAQILMMFFLALILSFFGNELNMPHYLHYVRNFIFTASISLYLFYKLDSNEKLVDRGTKMVMKTLEVSYEKANQLLLKYGSVRSAIDSFQGE